MSQSDEPASSPFEVTVPVRSALAAVTGLILAGLIFLVVETFNMSPPLLPGYPGDAFFPRLALAHSIIFALLILLRILVVGATPATLGYLLPTVSLHWLEFLSVIALVLLFALSLESIGFEIAGFGLLILLLVPRLHAPPIRALGIGAILSLATVLVLYATFGLMLKIPLPLAFLPANIS